MDVRPNPTPSGKRFHASRHLRWTLPVQQQFDAKVAALTSVPHAQPHEAPNSWLMRVAALQGCAPVELASYLGFTFREDFDYQYYLVFRDTPPQAPQAQGLELGRCFMSLPGCPSTGSWMNAPYNRRGRYRFCPLCLRHDRVPCVQLYTRMRELVFCPWHRCLLERQCPNCNAYLDLMQDMAKAGKRRHGVGDLSLCLACGDPLYEVDPLLIDHEFVYKLPYWLRHWGRTGPQSVEGPELDQDILSQEYRRLSTPQPSIAGLLAEQKRNVSALRAWLRTVWLEKQRPAELGLQGIERSAVRSDLSAREASEPGSR